MGAYPIWNLSNKGDGEQDPPVWVVVLVGLMVAWLIAQAIWVWYTGLGGM